MRRIKVIYVYAGFDWGMGGEHRILAIAKGLDAQEFDFNICLIENAKGGLGAEIGKLGWAIHELNLSRRFHSPGNAARVILELVRLFRREKPEVVHTQSVNANVLGRIAAKLARVPVVVATDNAPAEYERRLIARAFNSIANKWLDRSSDAIVAASEEILRRKGQRVGGREYHVLSTPAAFTDARDLRSLGESSERGEHSRPVLGVVGRLSVEKGQTYLIQAMPEILRRFPTARLLIVGDGPLKEDLRRQVRVSNLVASVEFSGYIPHSRIAEQWKRIDIAVVPSIHDARPVVTLEAMTAGLPLVATNVGGIPEVAIDGVTAIIVPPKEPNALARAIMQLLERPEDAAQMGQRGRQRALADFNAAVFVERHASMYRRLVSAALGDPPCDISYVDHQS